MTTLVLLRLVEDLNPAIKVMGEAATGADGYLLKENDEQKILDAILTVCQGGMVIDPAIARAAVARVQSGVESAEDVLAALTEQECHLLAALSTGLSVIPPAGKTTG